MISGKDMKNLLAIAKSTMEDTNKELRDLINRTKSYNEISNRVKILEKQAEENARIIGMSGNRELKLITELKTYQELVKGYRNSTI